MKKIHWLMLSIVLLVLVVSCKKKSDAITPPIVGYWVGKYGNGTITPNQPYAFIFRNDGTIRVYANNADTTLADKAEGTYLVSGYTISMRFKYIPNNLMYSAKSTANTEFARMEGTWGSGISETNGGLFNLTKVVN